MKGHSSHTSTKTSSLPQEKQTATKMFTGHGCCHVPELCLGIDGRVLVGIKQNGSRAHANNLYRTCQPMP